jgi:hypothetical protein
MSVAVEEEDRPRVKVRRRRAVLRLRQPELAYGPAALALLYAAGLMGMLAASALMLGEAASGASALSAPAFTASIVTALAIGLRLHRLQERKRLSVGVRTAYIWTFFGGFWPLLQIVPAMIHGDVATFSQFLGTLGALGHEAIAGAVCGGVGGVCGGAAAMALCMERVR